MNKKIETPQEIKLTNEFITKKIEEGIFNENITYVVYNKRITGEKTGLAPVNTKKVKTENPHKQRVTESKKEMCQTSPLGPNVEVQHCGTHFGLYIKPGGAFVDVGSMVLYSGVDKLLGKRFKSSATNPDGFPLVISIDSEWVQVSDSKNQVLSYQFSFVFYDDATDEFVFLDFVFFVNDDCRASLTDLLSFIVLGYLYNNYRDTFSHFGSCRNDVGVNSIHIVLVFHLASVDIRAFSDYKVYMNRVLDFSKSLASESLNSTVVNLSDQHRHAFSTKVMVRDTTLLVSDDVKSLANLGELVGVNKIDIGSYYIRNMDVLLRDNPTLYTSYALLDSFITLAWYNSVNHGEIGVLSPLTISSRSAYVIKEGMMRINGYKTDKEFNSEWRGLDTVKRTRHSHSGKMSYYDTLTPRPSYRLVDSLAINGYKGGRNESFLSGIYKGDTYDYDLSSAYPTAAYFCNDIDFDVEPDIIQNKSIKYGSGFINPNSIVIADISFEYPDDVVIPGIAQKEDQVTGSLLFTKKGRTIAYTPEIIEALEQGCDIFAHTLYIYTIKTPVTNSFFDVLLLLLNERKVLGDIHGKGSPIEKLAKMQVNAAIGKLAQGISGRKTFDLKTREGSKMPDSVISHPIYAGLITSYVRSMMSATMNSIIAEGYDVVNVTTDGFISNITPDKINILNYGTVGQQFRQARNYINNSLDDDAKLFEVKHFNKGWVGSTRTRLNFSPSVSEYIDVEGGTKEMAGVLARGGIKYPEELNGATDALKREWFIELYLNRSGRIVNSYKRLPSSHELYNGSEVIAFNVDRNISMDYDFKRKPLNYYTVDIDYKGKTYSVDSYTTEPFTEVNDYLDIRSAAVKVGDYNTNELVKRVEMVNEMSKSGGYIYKVNDVKSYYVSFLRHYRIGAFQEFIGESGKLMNGKQVIEYINEVAGEEVLTYNNWRKAKQRALTATTIPIKYLSEVIDKLGAVESIKI